ncbi:NIPSNAP family protein [Luteimonas cucumeris]|nr:NIPSNAP family protein [Luteimonas cucumeris]
MRQYTLHPGRRDTLIDLFERHLIEPQNAAGMEVLAHFRDFDAPDRFVWFRGFRDLAARGEALSAFYLHGTAWREHRDAANATMIDSDNVLLLREARPGSGFAPARSPRPPIDARASTPAMVCVTTYSFGRPVDDAFLDFFEQAIAPAATRAGAKLLAAYASEHGHNDFPQLPVREGENVFVWVAAFASQADHERHFQALSHSPRWRDEVQPHLSRCLVKPAEVRRLTPAARSLVQG